MNRDKVLALLEQWEAEARAGHDDSDDLDRGLAEAYKDIAPILLQAAEAGDVWAAVTDALWAGRVLALWSDRLMLRAARTTATVDAVLGVHDDVRRGVTVNRGAAKGGRERATELRRGGPSDAQLVAFVQAVHGQHPARSWTWVCEETAQRVNTLMRDRHSPFRIVGRTVQRRAKAADWR
jgi:hypothetical protein